MLIGAESAVRRRRIRPDFLTSISLTLELSQNRPSSVFFIKPNR
ncbi:hypothetical protein LEP1GSC008_3572 [Leptospira kirschneri serovar Bulgarica str. Nikolaevo]|uniref:Uncharacterized protein n=2 Tax=Leptospira kirschneri TaxID=29507 RepID=A0A0E2B2U4_9LEPT|nr:hypothetical protein LEP1GSC081_4254 [Leptospira kirschneri str. H1]EMK25020.1 hypothetical protein LEP1GSC008_3572 [Leptospira kirschneri serovar Bulgarica str. Nikolaevo]